MAYHSKYSGVEVDALLDKIKDDNVGSIDSSLSTTSENPVKNKVITEELNKKANKTDIATINGQPLTNGGNIEVITDAYDDTEIKGKLTELDSQIEGEATARAEADAALQTQINGKQDALTLTVKDNGNIVLANIQGQSKEFMPATPSGDPMHYAYVAAGAKYNDTGADIVKTAPWADLADDEADKTVIHKAGYWYLNGLGDITNEQMQRIYMLTASNQNYWDSYCHGQDVRTNIMTIKEHRDVATNLLTCVSGLRRSTIEVLKVPTNETSNPYAVPYLQLLFASKLKFVIGVFKSLTKKMISINIYDLKGIKIYGLSNSAIFSDAKNFSMKSVLYMINNEKATSPITITLHSDVYNKCMANADILTALEQHTNISLASA